MQKKTDAQIYDILKSFQKQHTKYIMNAIQVRGRALDASDTGVGKTYTSVAACMLLGLRPLVICPKQVLMSWVRTLNHFGCLYYGVTNYDSIQNCKWYAEEDELKCKSICPFINKKKRPSSENKGKDKENQKKYIYEWTDLPDDIILIFDEAHKCKNKTTVNYTILRTAADIETSKILLLSATIAEDPTKFVICGYVLKLYPSPRHAKNWLRRLAENNADRTSNVMTAVHRRIFNECGSRIRKKDVGEFQTDNIVAQCYDMDTAKEIQEQYELIAEEEQRLKTCEDRTQSPLAAILYARMRIETLKIPTMIKLAKQYLDEGNSVVVFVNFTQTLETLGEELKTTCFIYGGQTMIERQQNVDEFGADKSRIIIVNMQSGGVGISLHDTHGKYPRVSIVSPSWSAQDVLQCVGRIHRANGKTPCNQYIVYCQGTVEERICTKMKEKIRNIGFINDGDLDSYRIKGLMDDAVDDQPMMTTAQKMLQKIDDLNLRRIFLEEELKRVNEKIETTKTKLYSVI